MASDYARRLLNPWVIVPFVVVGAIGAVVDNAVLFWCVSMVGLPILVGSAVSKESSILVMFALNERWTFSSNESTRLRRRVLQSNLNRLGGVGIGMGALFALTYWVHVNYLLANVIGLGLGFASNYLSETHLTWKIHA